MVGEIKVDLIARDHSVGVPQIILPERLALGPNQPVTVYDVEIAFIMLLGRSAEEAGLEHYRKDAVNKGHTRAQLRDTIIGGHEYRASVLGGQRTQRMDGDGFVFFVDPDEPDFGRNIALNVKYEAHNLAMLRRLLKPGDTYVDVGANIGLLSLTARVAVGDGGKVICFEPMAENATLLMKSIISNNFNNIVVYPVALSDEVRTLYLEGHSNGKLMQDGSPERRMTTCVGDGFLAKEDRVDFLKIDIEGHEPLALRGLEGTLQKHKPTILCEFNPFMLEFTSKTVPRAFADQIFAMTDRVEAIDYDGNATEVLNAVALLDLCAAKNRYYVDKGQIADGILHMDLLFKVTR